MPHQKRDEPKREPVILTVPELAALADDVPERLRALVLVSAWCGLRWGEVTELRRKDIENDAEVIFVRGAVTHRNKRCDIGTTKSGKPRAVVVPPHIRADLKHHLDTFTTEDAEALVFAPARGGCHMNDRVFRDAIDPALQKISAGISAFTICGTSPGRRWPASGRWPSRWPGWGIPRSRRR